MRYQLAILCCLFYLASLSFALSDIQEPTINQLLEEAGYTSESAIQIHKTTLHLERDGEPYLTAYYYFYSTTQVREYPILEKVKVILQNQGDEDPVNLVAYAPMLHYYREFKTAGALDSTCFAHYIPKEISRDEFHNEYVVPLNSVKTYIFHYSDFYREYSGLNKGINKYISFYNIFKLCLTSLNENSMNGNAQLLVSNGEYHLPSLKMIYPIKRTLKHK